MLRLAAATTYSFTVVAVDPSGNASAPSAAVTGEHARDHRHDRADRAGRTCTRSTSAARPGSSGTESVDDVDPQSAILYEVRVNGVFDGAAIGIDRWITYGTQSSNTFTVQAVDSAGNRSPASSITLHQPGLLTG